MMASLCVCVWNTQLDLSTLNSVQVTVHARQSEVKRSKVKVVRCTGVQVERAAEIRQPMSGVYAAGQAD